MKSKRYVKDDKCPRCGGRLKIIYDNAELGIQAGSTSQALMEGTYVLCEGCNKRFMMILNTNYRL